eukprot:6194259-Amphidinium_carterae.1
MQEFEEDVARYAATHPQCKARLCRKPWRTARTPRRVGLTGALSSVAEEETCDAFLDFSIFLVWQQEEVVSNRRSQRWLCSLHREGCRASGRYPEVDLGKV